MAEIVPADPIIDIPSSSRINEFLALGHDEYVPEPFESARLPVTLAPDIQRFLHVANLIEREEPRIAYICRFHALEIALVMDRNSDGRGVRQFKTSLLRRLEQDDEITIGRRREKNDIRELRRVYYTYNDYISKNGGTFDFDIREKLMSAKRIVSVLSEVLKTITSAAGLQDVARNIGGKSEFYVPYNILPLDHGVIPHTIMQLPEV